MASKKAEPKKAPVSSIAPGTAKLSVKQRAFLKAYVEAGGIVASAARLARVHRSDHYLWLKQEAAYAAAFADAHEEACELHEAEVYRRGVVGIQEPVVYQGELTWLPKFEKGKLVTDQMGRPVRTNVPLTIRKYSDNLLMFRTKALMPDKYREQVNVSGSLTVDITSKLMAGRERVAQARREAQAKSVVRPKQS